MRLALKTLGIYLVDVLRAGGPRREPAALCHHFQAADGSIVARSSGQLGADRLARKVGLLYRFRCEFLQLCFLLGCGGRINACVVRRSELRRQFEVMLSGILAGAGGNLSCQQVHDGSVFVGRPHCAVTSKKTCSRTLFSAEATRTVDQAGEESAGAS